MLAPKEIADRVDRRIQKEDRWSYCDLKGHKLCLYDDGWYTGYFDFDDYRFKDFYMCQTASGRTVLDPHKYTTDTLTLIFLFQETVKKYVHSI